MRKRAAHAPATSEQATRKLAVQAPAKRALGARERAKEEKATRVQAMRGRDGLRLRPIAAADLADVTRIDAYYTGSRKPAFWKYVLREFLAASHGALRVGIAAEQGGCLSGYLLGEVRAVEFGSEPCGWIFAVGIDPAHLHAGVGSTLLREACARFRSAGVETVRTMVRRTDVPVLTFFRTNGFSGGPYVQLERSAEDDWTDL